jgi:hypothetical protein
MIWGGQRAKRQRTQVGDNCGNLMRMDDAKRLFDYNNSQSFRFVGFKVLT